MNDRMKLILSRDLPFGIIGGSGIYATIIAIGLLYPLVNPIWLFIIQLLCCALLVFLLLLRRQNAIHSLVRCLIIIITVPVLIAICAPLYRSLSSMLLPGKSEMQVNSSGVLSYISLVICLITKAATLIISLIVDLVSKKKTASS